MRTYSIKESILRKVSFMTALFLLLGSFTSAKAEEYEINTRTLLEKLVEGTWKCTSKKTGYEGIFTYYENGLLIIDGPPISMDSTRNTSSQLTWEIEKGFSLFENGKIKDYDGYWLVLKYPNGNTSRPIALSSTSFLRYLFSGVLLPKAS